jgi:hypothetical protein
MSDENEKTPDTETPPVSPDAPKPPPMEQDPGPAKTPEEAPPAEEEKAMARGGYANRAMKSLVGE